MEKTRYFISNSKNLLSVIHKGDLYSIFINDPDDGLDLQNSKNHKEPTSGFFENNKEISKKLAWLLCPHAFEE